MPRLKLIVHKPAGDSAMKIHALILLILATFGFCPGITAQSQKPLPILEVLPSAESLGPEWKRGITALFDPASQPPEIINTARPMPDSFKQERRAAVENPTNRISGWSHLHYEFHGTNGQCRYDVNIERHRSKETLVADFDRLLTLASDQYQKTEVETVGEAAVIYSEINYTNNPTLWFRRGNFRIWIAPLTSNRAWKDDTGLRHLAKALDGQIRNAAGAKDAEREPVGPHNK